MSAPDLILLHAPSVYDFRKRPILFGPVSDVVPSTPVFEMYPLGFMTILQYLEKHGIKVRIINIALKMLNSRRFNAEKFIRKLRPAAFGLDLHWMAHAQGSLELARICKAEHPDIPVIFGGLSASFFHEELIAYPQTDYVLRGDSTEEPLRLLMAAIKAGEGFAGVPNLTWKKEGVPQVNPLDHVPADMDGIDFDYMAVIRAAARSALRHLDFRGHTPFKRWWRYPIVAALTSRGCIHNCVICGGSAQAYRDFCGRDRPAFRSPEHLAGDIGRIARCIKAPVMVLNDLLLAGREYADEFLACLKKEQVTNEIAFEFFAPPPDDFIDLLAASVTNFNIQISPESHDEEVRRAFGRNYTNAALEDFIADALGAGCGRVDIFFMIGLPQQTAASVADTVDYCDGLLQRHARGAHGGRIRPFISPLAPFLDPGSRAFMKPDEHGYKLKCRSLAEHIRALEAPSWKLTLNYETEWMTADQIADSAYEAALALNQVKRRHGLLTSRQAASIHQRIDSEYKLLHAIDSLHCEGDLRGIKELMAAAGSPGRAGLGSRDEMNWPMRLMRFRPWHILRGVLRRTNR